MKHPDPDRLQAYAALVRRWASRLDLVSPGDLDRFEIRHVEDSLRLGPLVASLEPGPAVDVGSGAGLPGIPLAIAFPDREWRFVEPRRRRAAFLEEAVRELGLERCEVVPVTAEVAAHDPRLRRGHVLAVARALAPPTQVFALLLPLVRPGGIAAAFVGRGVQIPPQSRVWEPGIATMRADSPDDKEISG